MRMFQAPDDTIDAFRTLYPEISAAEITAAYERFRRYVRLGSEIAGTKPILTSDAGRGSVEGGAVDPSTFTNTG